jgi:hypothetical protein
MRHLKVGSKAYRVVLLRNLGQHDWQITEVLVVDQHQWIGTLFDSGHRIMSALHGELHETREEALDYVRDAMTARIKTAADETERYSIYSAIAKTRIESLA